MLGSTWTKDEPSWSMGARVLQRRLEQSLEVFTAFGVRIPTTGRHQNALSILNQWNNSEEDIDLGNSGLLAQIGAAHRTAWETYLIAVAANARRNRKAEDLFTRDRLSLMMKGSPRGDEKDTLARDTQFELYLGAILQLGGAEVHGGEPDLRFLYGLEMVGIAAKRISSAAAKQVRVHVTKAVEQIQRAKVRGFVAINIDKQFQEITLTQPTESLF